MSTEEVKNLIQSIGSLAEMLRIFYDNLIRCGFTNTQAIELCKPMVNSMIGGQQ